MPAPRKIFRIEETAAARLKGDGAQPPAYSGDMPAHHGEIMQALGALEAMMNRTARPPTAATAPGAAAELRAALLTRIAHELEAVTAGTAQATQRILTAAEEIDQLADNLSAALRGKIEQDLAHDISDQVIHIFEACNFQDLIGQRISKVMATLKLVEDNIASVLNGTKTAPPPHRDGAPSLHGPQLDSDHGHIAQSDIDVMFGS